MKYRKPFFLLITFITATGLVFSQGKAANDAPAPYFGEKPPGDIPVLFSPGLVSVPGRFVNGICMSEDGKECYFTVRNASWSYYEIMETHWESGVWTEPERASFSDGRSMSPSLADGDGVIYFCRGLDIWMSRRTGTGWAEPEKAPSPLSSAQAEYSCHVSSEGVAWICSHRPGGSGACDIWRVKACCGSFAEALNVSALNSSSNDCIPVPGPGEAFLLWNSTRPGGFGGADIYVSRPDGKGGWTAPVNAGPVVNTAAGEVGPYISPDEQYLFFIRNSPNGASVYWVRLDGVLMSAK